MGIAKDAVSGIATFVVMMADMEDLNAGPAILLGFALVVLSFLICKLYDRIKSKNE